MLIPRRFSSTRQFPHLSWAWPSGDRNALLIAAAHSDDPQAAEALVDWLSRTNLDEAQFPEQRLLVTAANRFPATRLEVPHRARLSGLVRMLWTKSRLSLSSAAPVLQALQASGVDVLVLKGMAAAALDLKNLKGRIAHDVDILVHGRHVPVVLTVLDAQGWAPDRGESLLYLRERGPHIRSINFLKRPLGDIDVHTRAYLTTSADSRPESGLWLRSARARFLDTDVFVPGATDRLMIAIAHGALDANRHSDWLADSARMISEELIEWPLLLQLAKDLSASAQVAGSLFYLRYVLDIAIPDHVLAQFWAQARGDPVAYFKALLLGYPRERHSLLSGLGRRIFKLQHSAQLKAANVASAASSPKRDIKMTRMSMRTTVPASSQALRHRLVVGDGITRCRILVGIDDVDRPRRYLFEINTSDRHIGRMRFRDRRGNSPLRLSAEVSLPANITHDDLWIEARQSGPLPSLHAENERAVLGSRPFRVSVSGEN
jgi:Uncharacterised nucleotidyltransferase